MLTKKLIKSFRSKFELTCAHLLDGNKIKFKYESEKLSYTTEAVYTPDFIIESKKKKIYIEAKGYFKPADRKKMLSVRKSNPKLDIRLWFQADSYINNKTKASRYSDWAKKNSFKYHIGETLPKEWFK